jgi:hypothetical protein
MFALMTMELLPLLMCRHPCCHQASIDALIKMASLPLIYDEIVALVAMALLPSSSWRCCPHCNGIVVIINAQASLPSLLWQCCPHCDGIVSIDVQASSMLSGRQLLPSL